MIILKHHDTPAVMAQRALDGILAEPSTFAGKTVLIKPNIGRVSSPGTGVCTHPEVVRGVIHAVRAHGAADILVGDGPIWGVDIQEALTASGIRAVCDQEGVTCVDLDGHGYEDVPIPDGVVVQTLRVSALVRKVDCIISVPVMKTHMYTGVSLGIKNMKGCLYKMEKTKLHRINRPVPDSGKGRVLDYGIADMTDILLPDYVVMDGVYGMEGLGPGLGTPRPLHLVLASDDALAADFAAIQLMGMPTDAIAHLNLIRARRRPEFDPTRLVVDPPDFLQHAATFAPASLQDLGNAYPHIGLVERGTCSACSAALVLFIRTHGKRFDSTRELVLGTGKDLRAEDLLRQTGSEPFCIGNCAAGAAKSLGQAYCKGCPPVGSSILAHIMGEHIDE